MTRNLIIKVCGMRNPANVRQLNSEGIDWLGFIFYPKSKRMVSNPIDLDLKGHHKWVGVFVNEPIEAVRFAVQEYALDIIQLHGDEPPEYSETLREEGVIVIKAFRVDSDFDFDNCDTYAHCVDFFLFDAKGKLPGGNGIAYDWSLLDKYQGSVPFLLSGGIGPELVSQLKLFKHPQWIGIDINSRFEISPAFKDIELIRKFKHELFS